MYLIVGANGFLGTYILKNILKITTDSVIAVARKIENVTTDNRIKWVSCEISNRDEVDALCEKVSKLEEVKVVFLAAYHNPDMVEKNPKIAWNINITSLSYFINRLENVRCFYYISTDSVYGNSVNGYHYKEDDVLNPVNTYGIQKGVAENIVIKYGYNVIRYPFLISPSLSPVKKHFYDVIVETLFSGRPIEMFQDSLRSTISFDTAAELLIRIIEKYANTAPSILNICGDDDLSKYDVGLLIAEKCGVSKELIVPVSTKHAEGIFEAARAQSSLMDNSKVKKLLGLNNIKLVI